MPPMSLCGAGARVGSTARNDRGDEKGKKRWGRGPWGVAPCSWPWHACSCNPHELHQRFLGRLCAKGSQAQAGRCSQPRTACCTQSSQVMSPERCCLASGVLNSAYCFSCKNRVHVVEKRFRSLRPRSPPGGSAEPGAGEGRAPVLVRRASKKHLGTMLVNQTHSGLRVESSEAAASRPECRCAGFVGTQKRHLVGGRGQ